MVGLLPVPLPFHVNHLRTGIQTLRLTPPLAPTTPSTLRATVSQSSLPPWHSSCRSLVIYQISHVCCAAYINKARHRTASYDRYQDASTFKFVCEGHGHGIISCSVVPNRHVSLLILCSLLADLTYIDKLVLGSFMFISLITALNVVSKYDGPCMHCSCCTLLHPPPIVLHAPRGGAYKVSHNTCTNIPARTPPLVHASLPPDMCQQPATSSCL